MDDLNIYSFSNLITIVISRDDVESLSIEPTLSILRKFIQTPQSTRDFMEKISIAIHGYDHDQRELDEIPQVRDFVHKLDNEFPYWSFFYQRKHLAYSALSGAFLHHT